jgi:DNA-binding NarL/FixJ family response regulator
MVRIILLYGLVIGTGAVILEWLNYQHLIRSHSTEFYVGCVALLFAAGGMWVGNRLTAKPRLPAFARNDAALASLGITLRECEVLELIAAGHSNKIIARHLSISPNTVKTHAARVFEKLEVSSRTQAIRKARLLDIVP